MKQETRVLTVSMISTTNSYNYGRKVTNVPYIRLQGKWLEGLGFNIGDNIVVLADNEGELRLKLVKASSLVL